MIAAVLHRFHLLVFGIIKSGEGNIRMSKLFGDHTTPIGARRVTFSAFKRQLEKEDSERADDDLNSLNKHSE